jgi:hypothetical protein
MYFRILINKNGEQFFRTSRLHSSSAAIAARLLVWKGAEGITKEDDADAIFEVTILQVNDEGIGHIMTVEEYENLVTQAMNYAEDASENAQPL